ncbi:uncharacterized protein Z518_08181 [Rhinocladiella mackenziei CBS 650.93]|uniref:PWWP domain-containing protein n=1 Tax=Rhinocladiella mackenziei CBS 650.93 TaxID=1442369 RepID=A0A0D2FJV0_9EURO|nr:uncharacterized protein Z518_08181 [Rhinocladiella mackenziei CBS 650.93]KIX02242.1 hypothetical protein Z518_08181 [Rhinocladiella mackenziei CBS 650.93]
MDADPPAPQTEVPVKAPEPEDKAPPTSAEPASGVVAEMSGALPTEQPTETNPAEVTDTTAANGAVDSGPRPPTEPQEPLAEPEATAPATGDTETKEEDEAEPAQLETNGTPAEKKSSSSKRKSSSGVADHKGKKLNKKKSMTKVTHLDAKPGEYYFARLKSYPPWPSIICDEEMLPEILLNTRPVTTKKADGTYNEAYADGGKKEADRTFPVMFLYTNEFAWIHNTDLTPLNPEECKDVPEKGKSKSLLAAYQVAAEGNDLQFFKNMLDDHAAAMQAEIDAKEARAAEKAAKAERKKRKSEAKADTEDVDMDDADAVAEPKKSSKKRKKEIDSDDEESEKPAKTPKTTKIKLTTNKTPKTDEKKPKEKATKAKAEKRKSKAATSDEEMVDAGEPEQEEKHLDPAEARKAREKEVLFLRHRLQKGFLSREQAPQEEEMPQMSTFIKKLEGYADLEVSIIRNTKINKVLKALIKLNTIPRDEEFQFRKRSVELLSQWNKILGAEPADAEPSGDKEEKASPTTNGVHDERSEEAPEDKKEEAPALTEKPDEASEEKPAEPEVDKPETDEIKEPETPAMEEPKPAPVEEPPKPEVTAPDTVDKAPESAEAIEATE